MLRRILKFAILTRALRQQGHLSGGELFVAHAGRYADLKERRLAPRHGHSSGRAKHRYAASALRACGCRA
ncbi:hypothetical protein D3C75_1266530 [compost metagenome]